MIKDKISVIIPLYGDFDPRRTLLSVKSILNQKDINLEIVVSEQGKSPKLICPPDPRVKHVFTAHDRSVAGDFNPGRVRNIGVAESDGEFLYTSDGDVVFMNPQYLSAGLGLLVENSKRAFKRPPMRRLPIENFEEFLKCVESCGIEFAIKSLDFGQEYLATTDGKPRQLKVVQRDKGEYPKVFTTSIENFKKYCEDPFLKGQEPTIWSENLHCGGNFLRREHFDAVGGYCTFFLNWGCEDSDLQWKVGEKYNLVFFPYTREFEVLHLDHLKGYFSKEIWVRNEALENQRKLRGIDAAIMEDKK